MFDAITYALSKAFTKKAIAEADAGNMKIEDYDTEGNGVVNDSRKLGGNLPSYYASTASIVGKMDKSVYDKNDNGIVDNAEKVNNHTVASDVPANAQFTDTKKLSDMTDTDFNDLVDGEAVVWDGTNEKFVNRVIQGGTTIVQIPSVVIGTYTYNGSNQHPTITGLDTTHCDVTGTSESVNAGDFTFTISLKDPTSMVWSDMTIADRTFTWSIAKADGAATLSKSTVELDSDTLSDVVTISGATGEMTITSSDATVATVTPASMSVPGGSVTISSVNNKSGNATITISVASSQNYNSTTVTINVIASFLKIVTWADGTDEEIAAMLEAHYNNEIDIADYWTVGDIRKIHLNTMTAPNGSSTYDAPDGVWEAQDITIVIVDMKHTDLSTSINGHTKAAITVQTRESISAIANSRRGNIYVTGYSGNIGETVIWSNSYLRTYLNNVILGAIASNVFKSAIKQSKNYRHAKWNTADVEEVTDAIFLPSYPEVVGTTVSSYVGYTPTSPTEGTQFKYYENTSNRDKFCNNNGEHSTVNGAWWLSSPATYDSDFGLYWCYGAGTPSKNRGNTSMALAPTWAM